MRTRRGVLSFAARDHSALAQMHNAALAVMQPDEEDGYTYPDRIEAFIEQELGLTLTAQQREICRAVERAVQGGGRIAIRSCHASGKTHIMAAIVIAFLHIYPYSKVITTAPGNTQVSEGLWQYVGAFYASAPGRLMSRPSTSRWRIASNWYAMGYKPRDTRPGDFQGFHAPYILIVADEAAEIHPSILKQLDSMLTGGHAVLVYIGNPTEVTGPFYEAFHENSDVFHCIKIAASDTPNIIAGRVVVPGLIDQKWIDEQIKIHGADSDYVRSRVHGDFPRHSATSWVTVDQVDAARERRYLDAFLHPLDIGIDIARTGDDDSALAVRQGEYVHGGEPWHLGDLMTSVGLIRSRVQAIPGEVAARQGLSKPPTIRFINVDETGIGAGVADRLKEIARDGGLPGVEAVNGINFASESSNPEYWPNMRQELWAGLRERFREGRIAGTISKEFAREVTGARFTYRSGYSMPLVETKEDMRKRLGRSPDHADAHALAFHIPRAYVLSRAATATPVSVVLGGSDLPHYAYDEDYYDDD